tara:strand:+ start:189 stop:2348 length:2160 start_codon:yes stop_codon:yes gene_type:complete
MKKFRTLFESTESVVFTFGRFNPPTTGHEKLLDKVKKIAGSSDYFIYPSHSQNPKKDPLPFSRKVAYMKDMFPQHKRNITTKTNLKTVLDIAVYLHDMGYKELNMVVGSDRVIEFKKLLNTYNGQEKRHGFYEFDSIEVFSAGDRDPDSEGVTGMSASKMRAAASNNNYEEFKKGLPRTYKNGEKLFKDVRKGMGLRESSKYSNDEVERDLYVRGVIYQIGDLVENKLDGTSGEVVRRGPNYVQYTDGENFYKAFLSALQEQKPKKITKVKQAKGDVADVKGTQPAKYYSDDAEGDKMSKSTKLARARHFAKGGSRDSAPGDKGAKTRPSQYTKKFKQMYGEPKKEGNLEEMPYYRKIRDKIHQMIHPKGYERIMKMYIDKIKSGMKPMQAAGEIGKEVRGVEGRDVIYYVNDLVKKGKLPKQLAASVDEDGPCWKTHKQVGMKMKNGKKVPNCVPKEEVDIQEKITGLVNKSKQTGVPYGILKKSYDRGMAAWKGGHRPGASQQQWAFARVNSMLTGGKADPDLQKQIKQGGYKDKKKKESYEIGADYARHTFDVTPGQDYKQSIKQKANKTNIKDWFERESVREEYQKKYEDYWWTALTETYDRMLEKIGTQDDSIDKYLDEGKAEYQGRKVNLNNPTKSDNPKKKYMVYVKNDKGNVVKVHYGDPKMQIQRDSDAARKSFRARHQCDTNPGPKYKARYWSCKFWEKGKSVTDLMKG